MEMMKQGAMMTVLSSLLTALALPATLLTLTDIIDSKWSIAVDRFFTFCYFPHPVDFHLHIKCFLFLHKI